MTRSLIFVFLFFFPVSLFGFCKDPIKNTYIVQTSAPNKLIKNKASFKIHDLDFIYNHKNNSSSSKLSMSSKKELNFSSLVVHLQPEEASQLKNKPYIFSLEQDCYVTPQKDFRSQIYKQTHSDNKSSKLSSFANDALYPNQWGIPLTKADRLLPETDHHTTIVGVSDSGFEYAHPDLLNNIWINKTEHRGKAGVDDDGNGCIDDIIGCDVTNKTGAVGVNVYASNLIDHGTHIAGIIGALQNNNRGIYGLAQNTQLMLVKGFSSSRRTSASDLLKTIYYAVDQGAEILNCSWSVASEPSPAEFSAFEYARLNDVLVVVAAGNESTYASKTSPGGLSNVLSVGSINSAKEISTFSNFGDAVDIYAPGGDGHDRLNEFISSLASNNLYSEKRGTSMAAPFITAVLANVKSVYPQATRNELMNLLFESAEVKAVYAYYDKNYKDFARIIDVENFYSLSKAYFSSDPDQQNLNYEPKDVRKPAGSSKPTHVSSSQGFDLNGSSSGCSRTFNDNELEQTAQIPVSLGLIFLPLFFALGYRQKIKRGTHKKNAS